MTARAIPVMLLLAACAKAPDAPPEPPVVATPAVVSYTATDFAFAGPDTIAPGMTEVRMVNTGAQEHHLVLGRLDEGKTIADIMELMAKDPNAEPSWLVWVGGAGGVLGGNTSASVSDLTPGRYVAFCFIPDMTDGMKPHAMKGMVKEIVVAGTANTAPAPTVTGEIRLSEFAFSPTTLTAGTHTLKIVNDGQKTHEIALTRLDDGATAESFLAALAPGAKGPPPGKPMGGNGAISPGKSNYVTLTLSPGTYLLVCFVPDSDGVPHIMKGMVQTIVVS